MNRRLVVTLLLSLVLCSLFTPAPGVAQGDEGLSLIEKYINDVEHFIHGWEKQKHFAIALAILVAILGIATGVLQKYDANWSKLTTLFVGATISGITVINNTAIQIDHRYLSSIIGESYAIKIKMEHNRSQYIRDKDEKNREALLDKAFLMMTHVITLSHKQPAGEKSVSFVASAFAQDIQKDSQRLRAWLAKIPKDGNSVYFIGIGDSTNVQEAQEASRRNAQAHAVHELTSQFEKKQKKVMTVNSHDLALYIVGSAEYPDTFSTYNDDISLYQYYTLMRIDKKITEAKLNLFAVQKKVTMPQELVSTIRDMELSKGQYAKSIAANRERAGFLELLHGHMAEARAKFGQAYAASQTYHKVDEIYHKVLSREFMDNYTLASTEQKDIITIHVLKEVLSEHAWGMPEDIKSQIEDKIKVSKK